MRRRVSAISCVALVVAALLPACGGGHAAHTSSSDVRSQATVTSSATSPANTTATKPSTGAYWPYEKVVGHLAGRSLALKSGTVHLQSALLECNGDGVPLKTDGTRRWSRYTCTQTLFQGGADHDVTFDVVISSATQLTISSLRTGPE